MSPKVAGTSSTSSSFLAEPVLGIECHSVKWHGGEQSQADVQRDRRSRALGIELLYFGWDEVEWEYAGVEREIRAAVRRRLSR